MRHLDDVHTIPARLKNDRKFDGDKFVASLQSLQEFDAKEIYLHFKNRSARFETAEKVPFSSFRMFRRCRFTNVPVRVRCRNLSLSESAGKRGSLEKTKLCNERQDMSKHLPFRI